MYDNMMILYICTDDIKAEMMPYDNMIEEKKKKKKKKQPEYDIKKSWLID